ncbi:MAG: TonB-dependent receptor [Prolixibacteraceae bacterium]|nr:TonB-dependent receptor [Prolixibacteraceae bacterium]
MARLCVLMILLSLGSVSASVYSQNSKLTLKMKSSKLADVFNSIEEQTDYYFFYNRDQLNDLQIVNVNVENKNVEEVLDELFRGQNIAYRIDGRNILIEVKEPALDMSVQQKSISGKVADSSGVPLPGVSVILKGTTTGTITDFDGKYTLANVSPAATLVFSFVGMKSQEVLVGSQSVININLVEETIGIDEVVAIGYGTVKKSDLTGAVATVSAKDFEKIPATNLLQTFQGRSTGVQITTKTGLPGAGANVLIRGVQSINGSNSPIYVVDGMITDNISNVNPNSIESISVLKDASAAAIYGARAANGVILITTKRGAGEKDLEISLNSYYGFQTESNLKLKLLTGEQFLDLFTEAYDNSGTLKPWGEADLPQYEGVSTDWKNLMLQTGIIQNYDLSLVGGSEKSNYYISADYLDQKGMVIETGYQKYTLNFNSDHKVNNWIKFGNSLNIYSTVIEGDGTRYVTSSDPASNDTQYAVALRQSPLRKAYEEDGDYGYIRNTNLEHYNRNPIWVSKNVTNKVIGKGLQGNLYLTLSPLKGLDITARGSMDYANTYATNFTPAVPSRYGWEGSSINSISKRFRETVHWIGDFLANYERTFYKDHNVKLLLGYTLEENRYEFLTGTRTGTPNDEIRFLDAGDPTSQLNTNGYEDWSFMSMFGRLNYTFKNKYLFTGTLRRDGTSRLSEGHRFGIFPSGSIAWRVSEEGFLKDVDFVNDLKIRASYGVLGNALSVGLYGTIASLEARGGIMDDAQAQGYTLTAAINEDLKWESTRKKNLGIDFTVLDNKLYSTINLFIEDTYDLLFREQIAYSSGLSGDPYINAGKVRNSGYEIELGYRNKKADWSYDVSFNLTYVKNEVVDLGGRDLRTSGIEEGYPVRSFFGYKSDGLILDPSQLDVYKSGSFTKKGIGDIHLLDVDGYDPNGKLTGVPDGKVDAADRTMIGHRNPDYTYGALGTVSYKNWSLQVQLQGVQGIDLSFQPYGSYSMVALMTGIARNEDARVLNRYHATKNPNGTWPRLMKDNRGDNITTSDFWLKDASYLRVRNINLGYNIPQRLCSKLGLRQLNLFSGIQNAYTFTKYDGAEVDTTAEPDGVPQPRTWTFGFKVTF